MGETQGLSEMKRGAVLGHKKRSHEEMERIRHALRLWLDAGGEIKAFGYEHGINPGQVYHFARDINYRARMISDDEYAHIQDRRKRNPAPRS